jgi:hypothetical protein
MPFRFTLRDLFFCVTIGSVLFAGLLAVFYALAAARNAAMRSVEASQVFQSAYHLERYRETHGHFPPAVLGDPAGSPPMSWRVVLTESFDESVLAAYRPDQPWNSPANMTACDVDYSIYSFAREVQYTNVVMPTGPGTIGAKSVTLDDITDRRDETILVIGLKESDILWHEPRDLSINDITRAPDDPKRILIKGKLFQGAWCCMVQGRSEWLPADLDYDTFRAMLTVSGGEKVDMSWAKRK